MTVSDQHGFLNLDLIVESISDLAQLAGCVGDKMLILTNERGDGHYILALELSDDRDLDHDPQKYTERFIEIIMALPPDIRKIWDDCVSRTFDYGFRCGTNEVLQMKLPPSSLLQMAELGVELKITPFTRMSCEGPDRRQRPGSLRNFWRMGAWSGEGSLRSGEAIIIHLL
jgi:hypothetical protein